MNKQSNIILVKNIFQSSDGQMSNIEFTKKWITHINALESKKQEVFSLQNQEVAQ